MSDKTKDNIASGIAIVMLLATFILMAFIRYEGASPENKLIKTLSELHTDTAFMSYDKQKDSTGKDILVAYFTFKQTVSKHINNSDKIKDPMMVASVRYPMTEAFMPHIPANILRDSATLVDGCVNIAYPCQVKIVPFKETRLMARTLITYGFFGFTGKSDLETLFVPILFMVLAGLMIANHRYIFSTVCSFVSGLVAFSYTILLGSFFVAM